MISVLGAGVAGLCCATSLAEAGHRVELIDTGAPAVSRLAGGMLAPFCEGDGAPEAVVTLGQASVDWWAARVPGVTRRGTLVVAPARDSAELARFARATRGHVAVDPGTLEPELAGRFATGLFFDSEAHLDPVAAMAALRAKLVKTGVPIHRRPPRGRIIDCTGMGAPLHDLRPVRGEMMELHAPDVTLTRPLRLLHPRFACYLVPRGGGRYMLGATMVESGSSAGISARAMMELLSAAYTLHPALAEAEILYTGTGLRPALPDNLPAIRHDADRIHVNGMYRHGFLMAPVLAGQLTQMMTKEMHYAH